MSIRSIWLAGALSLASAAFAGLGDAPAAVPAASKAAAAEQAGAARAKGVELPDAAASYTTNVVPTADGGKITEYVSRQGVVFGISWRTPMMPNMKLVLGNYFPSFEQSAAASRGNGRRGPLHIQRADLVLQSVGQLGDFRGRAFVPGLLPPDVDGDAIR